MSLRGVNGEDQTGVPSDVSSSAVAAASRLGLAHPWHFAAADSVLMFFVGWIVSSSLGAGVLVMILFFVGQGWSAKRGRVRRYYMSGVRRLDRRAP
jgi:hypothetical protein